MAHRTRGVREPEHVRKLFVRKPGDPGVTGCHPQSARSGKAEARQVRAWEVGRRNIIDEGNEQRCTTRDNRPTTAEFVEKRPPAEGNRIQTAVTGTQGLEAASIGLNRVREARINVFCV